jgi:hypothetical protein
MSRWLGPFSGCGLDIRALLLYLPRASVLVLVNFLFCPSLGMLSLFARTARFRFMSPWLKFCAKRERERNTSRHRQF